MVRATAILLFACLLLAGCSKPAKDFEDGVRDTLQGSATTGSQPGTQSSTAATRQAQPPNTVPADPAPPGGGSPQLSNGTMRITFFDVGQGDATLIEFPDAVMTIDNGDWRTGSDQKFLDYIQSRNITRIDWMTLSNPDADHVGGCRLLYQELDVLNQVDQGFAKDTETWRNCLLAQQAENAHRWTDAELDPGMMIPVSKHATVQLLYLKADSVDANSGSVAVRITLGNVSVLFPGDMPCSSEDQVLAMDLQVRSDVLKAGHHGSRTSTCAPWLTAVQPSHAIISAAANSQYGHPHTEVMQRLSSHGVEVLQTSQVGSIVLTTDGKTMEWSSDRTYTEPGHVTTSALTFSRVIQDPPGDDNANLNSEVVEILNTGADIVTFTGYTLRDNAGHTFAFPNGFQLASYARVTIHTGPGTNTDTDLYWGLSQSVWNNDHDKATLKDAGGLIVAEIAW